jgi:nitronate monooxygenase
MPEPVIIQGGMGVGVSGWPLARAVSRQGQIGVVSGTALDTVFVRRLQLGDPGGHLRRALARFPVPQLAQRILKRFFLPGGKAPETGFALLPLWTMTPDAARQELTIVANFVEVFLAKEGHDGLVGINYLEKIQLPMLPSLYGALLASVDYVLMGAGIPREIPGALDHLARHEAVSLRIHVEGATATDDFRTWFDPKAIIAQALPPLKRPKFLAIIASSTLALALLKKATGRIDGFVVEGPTAGGHNAPPRGELQLTEGGEPVYGSRDTVDLEVIKSLGLPFWLAGSYGAPEQVQRAVQVGATGVQVGTLFAFCQESGIAQEIKVSLIEQARRGKGLVFTDPRASPAGFPFKVVHMDGSLSEPAVYDERPRLCDLGYLRAVYKKADGTLGYRCPAEPVETYQSKEGACEETGGRKCLCNGLMATIGLPQRQRHGYVEPPLVTAGDEFTHLARMLKPGQAAYTAAEVIAYLLGASPEGGRAAV